MEILNLEEYKKFKKINEAHIYNKFNTVEGIKQRQYEPTKKHIVKNLTYLFNLDESDFSFVGSAGKLKNDDDISYNINLGINKTSFYNNNKFSQDGFKDYVKDRVKILGYDFQVSDYDSDEIYLLWDSFDPEEDGDVSESNKNKSKVTLNCVLTENFDWLNFSRYCPDIRNGESEYPTKYRECLITSIVNEAFDKEILEYFDLNDTVKEYKKFLYLPNKGLYKENWTFSGKNGVLKNSEPLENTKKLITNEPKTFSEMIMGEGVKPNQIKTFESCISKVKSKNFPYKKQRERILESCKNSLISKRLELPKEL